MTQHIPSHRTASNRFSIRYVILYLFFAICILELMPHLEILINPKIRIFSQQKMIYALSFFYLFFPVLFKSKHIQLRALSFVPWIFAFSLAIFISALVSIDPKSSLINVARYMGYFMFYFMVFFYIRSYRDIERLLFLCAFLGSISFLVGHFIVPESVMMAADPKYSDSFGGSYYSPVTGVKAGRAHLLTWNANTFGYLSALLVFVPFYFITAYPKKTGGYNKYGVNYILFVVFVYFLVISLSRGAFLAFICAFSFLILLVYKVTNRRMVFVFIVMSMILFFSPLHLEFSLIIERYLRSLVAIFGNVFHFLGVNPDRSASRLDDIKYAWEVIQVRPLLGCGFIPNDVFLSKYAFLPETINHLFYLQFIVYSGFVGFFFYIVFLLKSIFRFIKVFSRMKKTAYRTYLLGGILLSLCIVILIKGFFAPLHYELWLVLGLVGAFTRITYKNRYHEIMNEKSASMPANRLDLPETQSIHP